MAYRSSIEDTLCELKHLCEGGVSPSAVAGLKKALSSRISLVAAKAAEISGEFEEKSLIEALEKVFDRFMANPIKNDKGCRAKTAAVEALYAIGAPSADIYLRGIRYVQMEPSYGPPVDTAARLRGLCGMALVRMSHPAAMNELARLLTDGQNDARIMAARAVAYAGNCCGEPLLRFKVYCGDIDPQVMSECFLALLRLEPESSMPFVAAYLEADDTSLVESAATALGESRLDGALPLLQVAYRRNVDANVRHGILLAIAALRRGDAVKFLLDELANAAGRSAELVLTVLATLRHDPVVRERVSEVVDQKQDRQLSQILRTSFGD